MTTFVHRKSFFSLFFLGQEKFRQKSLWWTTAPFLFSYLFLIVYSTLAPSPLFVLYLNLLPVMDVLNLVQKEKERKAFMEKEKDCQKAKNSPFSVAQFQSTIFQSKDEKWCLAKMQKLSGLKRLASINRLKTFFNLEHNDHTFLVGFSYANNY